NTLTKPRQKRLARLAKRAMYSVITSTS
ncbi:hypothetical protein D046_3979B, partial [Vibrio parahaemolyticus V-223/04]